MVRLMGATEWSIAVEHSATPRSRHVRRQTLDDHLIASGFSRTLRQCCAKRTNVVATPPELHLQDTRKSQVITITLLDPHFGGAFYCIVCTLPAIAQVFNAVSLYSRWN